MNIPMHSPKVSFTVFGLPQPAGSKKAFPIRRAGGKLGVAVTDANPEAKMWKNAVTSAAIAAFRGDLLTGPLVLECIFYMPRPKGHYGSGKNTGKLKRTAPTYPIVKPDTLKLTRGTEDACTGIVWRDDSQVVVLRSRKFYGHPTRCEVTIYELAS